MKLSELKRPLGLKKRIKRVGRGQGSGWGETAGKGGKGYYARAGSKYRPWYEGGQMSIHRRLPKRGFNNKRFSTDWEIVNLKTIAALSLSEINQQNLFENGVIHSLSTPLKILGVGEINKAMYITANSFSLTAKKKIEEAGGKATLV